MKQRAHLLVLILTAVIACPGYAAAELDNSNGAAANLSSPVQSPSPNKNRYATQAGSSSVASSNRPGQAVTRRGSVQAGIDSERSRSTTPISHEQALLNEGLLELSAGRYHLAEPYFRELVHRVPTNAMAHYYYANVLVYERKHLEAKLEYSQSYRLDPYGPVSGYCRRALLAYKVPLSLLDAEHQMPPPASSAAVTLVAPPTTRAGSPLLTSAFAKIRHDAEGVKTRHQAVADSLATSALRSGEVQAGRIQDNARDEIDRILHPPPMINGRLNPAYLSPEVMKAQADEVRRQADEAARIAREMAQEKSQGYSKWTQAHAKLLDESADNLEHLMQGRALPGTPKLEPVGTGLFVRNYTPTPGNNLPDYHQSVARIRPVYIGPQPAQEVPASQDPPPPSHKRDTNETSEPYNDVRGSVVH